MNIKDIRLFILQRNKSLLNIKDVGNRIKCRNKKQGIKDYIKQQSHALKKSKRYQLHVIICH
jgi:hypothetical protein